MIYNFKRAIVTNTEITENNAIYLKIFDFMKG